MIYRLFNYITKKVHIQYLLYKKEFALLYAKYMNDLSTRQEAYIICHLKMYGIFLTIPKWSDSIFFKLGLISKGLYPYNEKNLQNIFLCKDFNENRDLFISHLLPYSLDFFQALCNNKKSWLYQLSQLSVKNKPNTNKEIIKNLEFHKTNEPQFYLIRNITEENNLKKLNNLNIFLSCYKLENIQMNNKQEPPNSNNLRNIKKIKNNEKENLPLVSVILTTFNNQEYIENTIDSLINQTYSNIEIIIIDDNSNDRTKDIITRYTTQYSNIKGIYLHKNVGTYIAKSIGVQYAEGNFITCQDSDDWAHPQKIEYQMKPLLKNPNIVVTFSKWVRIDYNGIPYSRFIYPLVRLNPSSALFRKDKVISKTGLWDWVRIGADSEFNARLKLVFGRKAYCTINKPLTFGSHRNNSLMTSDDTGYVNGISKQREKYWFEWNIWHISQLRKNKRLVLPNYPKRYFYK